MVIAHIFMCWRDVCFVLPRVFLFFLEETVTYTVCHKLVRKKFGFYFSFYLFIFMKLEWSLLPTYRSVDHFVAYLLSAALQNVTTFKGVLLKRRSVTSGWSRLL